MAKKKIAKRQATKKKVGRKKPARALLEEARRNRRLIHGDFCSALATIRPGAGVKIGQPVGEQTWARSPCVELLALLFLIQSVGFTRHQDLAHEWDADDTPNPVGLFPLCNSSMTQA